MTAVPPSPAALAPCRPAVGPALGRFRPASRTSAAMLLGLLVLGSLPPGVARARGRVEGRGVRSFCHMVPMQDGTRLATDVYLPRFPRGCYPAILIRTPDGKHEFTRLAARYVSRRGCALVVQDTRGRYQSGGGPRLAFIDDGWGEHRDGHDTIRWIARQPWCNGRVATWGVSSMGVTQNMLAPGAPEALRAQYVMMAFSDMYAQAAYQGGVFRKELVEGWLKRHHYHPLNLAAVLAHWRYDLLWESLDPEEQAARVNAPAVFVGGWHDAFLQGAINSFVTIQHQGGPRARGRCRLVIGPWDHGDIEQVADPRTAACRPRAAAPFRFFEYHLKGRAGSVPRDRPVHYYVMGDRCGGPGNHWRAAEDWPPRAQQTPYYFHADGRLEPATPEQPHASLSYQYDPGDPVPTLGGRNLYLPAGPLDQRPVESRADVLLFTSQALAEPLEVTGPITAELFVSSDCPDTDFTVKLTDVYPDGRSLLVCDGICRARFRESFSRERLLEPGEVVRLSVDLWSTSIVFGRGHRMRVAVSSSNCPRFEPNPNNGHAHFGEAPPRVAQNRLHLSAEHASHIVLPIRSERP